MSTARSKSSLLRIESTHLLFRHTAWSVARASAARKRAVGETIAGPADLWGLRARATVPNERPGVP